ncbi:carboxymuconolactone decarboxylase family protein [Dactylosporangium sp. CA-233914]|uniref:carboxymuconolactone decarboxylase family protein n=1 Tax=Dactylosporangium sp. CA-233914 TaxID=3239934 RepID=UPI003D8FE598
MIGFLHEPELSEGARRLFDDDVAELGYVMNVSRLWAYAPEVLEGLFKLTGAVAGGRLDLRTRGILVTAFAGAFGDSYCALSWGGRLAEKSDAATAAGVIAGTDDTLSPAERQLAAWARKVAREPSATRPEDVEALREAGFSDADIFAITAFVALRIAFATVNDALGLSPDAELAETVAAPVLNAVTFGRPIAAAPKETQP